MNKKLLFLTFSVIFAINLNLMGKEEEKDQKGTCTIYYKCDNPNLEIYKKVDGKIEKNECTKYTNNGSLNPICKNPDAYAAIWNK